MKTLSKITTTLFPFENRTKNILYFTVLFLLFLYCFSIPTFSNRLMWNYLSISISALLVLSIIIYIFLYGKWKIDLFVYLLLILNVLIVTTHIINGSFRTTPKTVFLMSIISFFLYQFLSCTNNKNITFYLILLSGLLFAIVYFVYYRNDLFPLKFGYGNRLGYFFDNQNEISKEFGFFGIISFSLLLKNYKNVKVIILSSLSLLLFLFLILTTGSISNLITLLIVCFITLAVSIKSKKGRIISFVCFACAIAAFIALLQIPALYYFKMRIINIFSTFFGEGSNYDTSALSRFDAALTSFKVGLNRVLFGHGYMSATSYTLGNYQSHNNFAELFIDFGFLGLLIFEVLLIYPLISKQNNAVFSKPLLIYVFTFQLFLTLYYKKYEYIILPACFASIQNDNGKDLSLIISLKKKSSSKTYHSNKIQIVEIIPSLYPVGGAETFVTNFILSINKKYTNRVNVTLVLLYDSAITDLEKRLANADIRIIKLNKRRGLDFKCAFRLKKVLKEIHPDVIHTHLNSLLTLKLAVPIKPKNVSFVHTIHHNAPTKFSFGAAFDHYLYRNNYTKPIAVASVPSSNYSKLLNITINCINNGVDLDSFNSSLQLKKRKIDFLCVGRFVPVKNQMFILKLIKKYYMNSNTNFCFLGDGPLLEECKAYVKENHIPNVSFEGFVDDGNRYMANSKVLLMPSLNEGNPMVVNEALASGMMVVGSDVGGIHDLLVNLENCFLCEVNNEDSFYLAMERCLKTIKAEDVVFNVKKSDYSIDHTVALYFETFGITKEVF